MVRCRHLPGADERSVPAAITAGKVAIRSGRAGADRPGFRPIVLSSSV